MKFDGLEPRRYEDIKGIVAPEIGPKSFGTLEKRCGRYFNSSPSTPGRGKLLGLMLISAGGKKKRPGTGLEVGLLHLTIICCVFLRLFVFYAFLLF